MAIIDMSMTHLRERVADLCLAYDRFPLRASEAGSEAAPVVSSEKHASHGEIEIDRSAPPSGISHEAKNERTQRRRPDNRPERLVDGKFQMGCSIGKGDALPCVIWKGYSHVLTCVALHCTGTASKLPRMVLTCDGGTRNQGPLPSAS